MLAPHRDDASLWLGGLAQRVSVSWLTVFSRCCWTNDDGARPDRIGAVTRLRAREDVRAADKIGARLLPGLGFREAPLRGYAKVLIPEHPVDADPVLVQVAAKLERVIRRLSVPLVLAPLGAGGHIDHMIVTEAARRACAATATPVAYYEDPNIKDLIGEDIVTERARALLGRGVERVDVAVGRARFERKSRALAAYRSQLSPEVIELVRAHAVRCRYRERLYVTPDRAGRLARRALRELLASR